MNPMRVRKEWLPSLLLAGGAAILAGGLITGQSLPAGDGKPALIFSSLGAGIFLEAVVAAQRGALPSWLNRWLAMLAGWFRLASWQAAVLLLAGIFTALAALAAGPGATMVNGPVAVGMWLAAIGSLLAIGVERISLPPMRRTALQEGLALFAAAFVIRVLHCGTIPIYLTGDEGSAGIEALNFAEGRLDNIFVSGWYGFPTLYFFLQSLSVRVLGNTTEALRVPSALAGAATVVALYLVAARMFDRRTALVAAVFLASLHYHVHFSRIGLNNIWDGFWFVAVVGLLWWGWERERRQAYVLAGLGLGFAQYFYMSARSLLLLALGWIALSALVDRRKWRSSLPDFLLMVLAALVVVFPLAWFYFNHPDEFMAPVRRVSILGDWLRLEAQTSGASTWAVLWGQLTNSAGALICVPLRAWYAPGTAILRPFQAALFVMGLILLLRDRKDCRFSLLMLWAGVFTAVGALSESTPAAQRYVAAAPLCALMAAYGLSGSFSLAERLWPERRRQFAIAVSVVMLATAYRDINFYFFRYTPKFRFDSARDNTMVAQVLASQLMGGDRETEVIFFGWPRMGFYSIPSVQFLAPGVRGLDIRAPWGTAGNPKPTGEKLLFVFLPDHAGEIALVRADYPDGKLGAESAADGGVLYHHYQWQSKPR